VTERSPRSLWSPCALLLALTAFVAFARALGHDFLIEEDREAVVENPLLRQGFAPHVLEEIFVGTTSADTALGRLSHVLVSELFGPGPAPAHAANLALHAANVALLFLVLARPCGRRAALLAALAFAFHPLQLPSVTWVASRGVLLAQLLLLLACCAFLGSRAAGRRRLLGLACAIVLASLALVPALSSAPSLLPALPRLARGFLWPFAHSPVPADGARGFYGMSTLLLALLVLLGTRAATRAPRLGKILLPLAALAPLALLVETERLLPAWRDQGSLARAALARDPRDGRALQWLARDALERGKLTLASDLARTVLELDREAPSAHLLLGTIALRRPRLEDAERACEAALALEPEAPQANALLGEVLFRVGDPESLSRAAEHFERALAASPLALRALTRLSLVRIQLGDPQGAREAAGRALEIDAENREAWLARGEAAELTGDDQGAIAAYRKALAIEPDYAEALTQLGAHEIERGELADARELLERAYFVHPLFPDASFQFARCLEAQGELDPAIRYYGIAVEQNPRNERAKRSLAELRRQRGEGDGEH